MTKVCDFNVDYIPYKGGLQGMAIDGDVFYALRNIKDTKAGIPTYSAEEKGRIYTFNLATGEELSVSRDMDLGHQSLSIIDTTEGKFFLTVGTTIGEEEGTTCVIISETFEMTETFRLIDTDKDYHRASVGYLDGFIYAVFNHKEDKTKKLFLSWSLEDIRTGNYNNTINKFEFMGVEDEPMQDIEITKDLVYVLFGDTDKEPAKIVKFDFNGKFLGMINLFPTVDSSKLEPEGMARIDNDLFVAFHQRTGNNTLSYLYRA